MTIEQLPTFIVRQIGSGRAVGSFDDSRWMGERHMADLVTPGERFVCGRFVEVDVANKSASFVPTAPDELAMLCTDTTYRRLDGYWGERAALVLDWKRHWEKRAFEPMDAVSFGREGGLVLAKSPNDRMPPGGTVVKGGWDHEHCDICWATISPRHDPVAMFSAADHWVCCECYHKFVVPRSLDFIVGEQSGQTAGEG